MNVIYDLADIRISETHTQRVEVPRWEIPVLQVIHGNDVVVVGQTIVKRAIPDPGEEFQRLAARYGPKNEDVPAVAAIYGNFGPGTAALRNEIRDSLTSADATPSAYKSPAERKIEAEKAAAGSGQTIAQEAKAREDAAANGEGNSSDTAAKEDKPVGPDSVELIKQDSKVDADIASLI